MLDDQIRQQGHEVGVPGQAGREPRERLRGDRGTTGVTEAFEHRHRQPGPGEVGRGGQAIVPAADDHHVIETASGQGLTHVPIVRAGSEQPAGPQAQARECLAVCEYSCRISCRGLSTFMVRNWQFVRFSLRFRRSRSGLFATTSKGPCRLQSRSSGRPRTIRPDCPVPPAPDRRSHRDHRPCTVCEGTASWL